MALPRYKLTQDSFFPPHLIKRDSVIEWSGTPGPHMIPMNDEAEAAMEEYYRANPHASLNPVDGLRLQGGDPGEMMLVDGPQADNTPVISVADMSANAEETIAAKGRSRKTN